MNDNSPTPKLQIKWLPESLQELRREILNHHDIFVASSAAADFSEALGIIAAKLNIALDGDYDVDSLCSMLVSALRNRSFDRTVPPEDIPGLMRVNLVETDGEVSLLPESDADWQKEFAQRKDDTGALPPYTICLKCKTEFDCCSERSCGLGQEVQQLGWPVGHKGFIRSSH